MKRKLISAAVMTALTVTSVAPAIAAPAEPTSITTRAGARIPILVDDMEIYCDQPPVIIDGRTLVPLRAIFEALGARVDWNGDTRSVTATRGDTTILLTIGNTTMYRNGVPTEIDVPGQIISDRTMVPVRAVSESFGADVVWDNDARTVFVYSDAYHGPTEPEEPVEPDDPVIDEPSDPVDPEPSEPGAKPDDPEATPPEEDQPIVDDQAAAYNSAMDLYKNGYSYQAYYIFKDLGDYKDSAYMMQRSKLLNRISYNYNDYTSKWFLQNINSFEDIQENQIMSSLINNVWLSPNSQSVGYDIQTYYLNGTFNEKSSLNINYQNTLYWMITHGGIYIARYDMNEVQSTLSWITQKDFRKVADDVYANIITQSTTPIRSGATAQLFIRQGSDIGNAFEAV